MTATGKLPEETERKLESLAQAMGNAGYCAYEPCREYLRAAYRLALEDAANEAEEGRFYDSDEGNIAMLIAADIRALGVER